MTRLPNLTIDLLSAAQARPGRLAGLDLGELRASETAYRRFFLLAAQYPEKVLAPTVEIDEMWHLHMLHPKAYAEDCMAHLGYLMDHDAGFGFTPQERPLLLEAFRETGDLWAATFGESYSAGAPGTEPTNCDKKQETNCDKKKETNCDKKRETNCDKKQITNCDKAMAGRERVPGTPLSVDLLEAARRSDGTALSGLPMEVLQSALEAYVQRFKEGLAGLTPESEVSLVYAFWCLHMLHPVAYREDCLACFGEVKDHAVETLIAQV